MHFNRFFGSNLPNGCYEPNRIWRPDPFEPQNDNRPRRKQFGPQITALFLHCWVLLYRNSIRDALLKQLFENLGCTKSAMWRFVYLKNYFRCNVPKNDRIRMIFQIYLSYYSHLALGSYLVILSASSGFYCWIQGYRGRLLYTPPMINLESSKRGPRLLSFSFRM